MKELTLYEIMAEDLYIYARNIVRDDIRIGIRTTVQNETDDIVFEEDSHIAAWDSLVYFAKQVVRENEKLERENDQQ